VPVYDASKQTHTVIGAANSLPLAAGDWEQGNKGTRLERGDEAGERERGWGEGTMLGRGNDVGKRERGWREEMRLERGDDAWERE